LANDVRTVASELKRLRLEGGRRARIDRYFANHQVRKLHVGAGENVLPDWLNTDLEPQHRDIVYLDITERLPFPDRAFAFVFSEHLIEHVSHEVALVHLQEIRRVLTPGGQLRVATPNLQFLIDLYTRTEHTATELRYIRRIIEGFFPTSGFEHPTFVMNAFMRGWGHQFIYDHATLAEQLCQAGFVGIRRCNVFESDQPPLRGIELHGDAISEEFNLLQTMVFEGTRPVE
jgi:predicted SAM-dependent methyltransferase